MAQRPCELCDGLRVPLVSAGRSAGLAPSAGLQVLGVGRLLELAGGKGDVWCAPHQTA